MIKLIVIILFAVFLPSAFAEAYNSIDLELDSQRPGGDYTSFRAASAEACAQKCEKSRRCQAFDFYKSDNSCWLKNRAYSARYYAGVVSGFKRSGSPEKPSVDATSIDMDIRYDIQRPGGDYRSFRVQSVQQCSENCTQDSQCQAFDYTTSDSFCYLKSWKPPAREYRGIISGVKRHYNPQLKSVQELLIQQDYNPGTADGLMGRNTRIALEKYQRDHNLLVTGRLDNATLNALGLHASAEYISQKSSVDVADIEISEEYAEESIPTYIKTIGVTYLQLENTIYAAVLAKIPADTVLQVISQHGEWYKVAYQKQVGFVLGESVQRQ
ncbi:SH3 domain-containing protein,putative peptidoglycan binding protein [Desulfocapsa sulfexigens DSM 10523]|uniref:SH3 domain-containing protein,putative peptidoglycan binding protein n=1 Tax=Desulfocapsa sulfexigens (strain DSM 10523 / SB164P1) TaxID=1167006 RepID=M1NBW9_DESSD|nr:PAN domain-containing protein [Desulfocapsa sulfexigens]AGF77299.1 SH3 domain-containing protein,putative peptidoglycan binding protein [Desulfocapsa sulfexigens DSM 10523]